MNLLLNSFFNYQVSMMGSFGSGNNCCGYGWVGCTKFWFRWISK